MADQPDHTEAPAVDPVIVQQPPSDQPAAPLGEPLKPLLKGSISQDVQGRKYQWQGQWMMKDGDAITADFSFSFEIPNSPSWSAPLHGSGTPPANPYLPSAPEHPPLSVPASGHFLVKDKDPPTRIAESNVRLCIGGAVQPGIPSIRTSESAPYPSSELVAIAGEGVAAKRKYSFLGAYHAVTGTAWAYKVYHPVKTARSPAPVAQRKRPAFPKSLRMDGIDMSVILASTPRERRQAKPREDGLMPDGGANTPGMPAPVSLVGEMKAMNEILQSMKRHQASQYFLVPVDPVQHQVPDYFNVVKRPMDLSTVERKLRAAEYANHEAFASDMLLIASNAILYNGREHNVGRTAEAFERVFDDKYSSWLRKQEERRKASTAGAVAADKPGKGRGKKTREESYSESDGDGTHKNKKVRLGAVPQHRGPVTHATAVAATAKAKPETSESDELRSQLVELTQQIKMLLDAQTASLRVQGNLINNFGMTAGQGVPPALMPPAVSAAPAAAVASAAPAKPKAKAPAATGGRGKPGIDTDFVYADDEDYDEDYDYGGGGISRKRGQGRPRGSGGRGRPPAAHAPPGKPALAPGAEPPQLGPALIALTYDEKKQLSSDVALLQPQQVDQVLQIVAERVNIGDASGAAEVELDMDALDTGTLRELQRYVAQCLGRAPPVTAAQNSKNVTKPHPKPGGANHNSKQAQLQAAQAQLASGNVQRLAQLEGLSIAAGAGGTGQSATAPPVTDAVPAAAAKPSAYDSDEDLPPPPPPGH